VKNFKLHFNLTSVFFQLQGLTWHNEAWLRFAVFLAAALLLPDDGALSWSGLSKIYLSSEIADLL
jgi:hypothetical protein